MKQPSAMCCPLSGGGSGSPVARRQRLHRAAERRPRLVHGDVGAALDRAQVRSSDDGDRSAL